MLIEIVGMIFVSLFALYCFGVMVGYAFAMYLWVKLYDEITIGEKVILALHMMFLWPKHLYTAIRDR